MSVGAGRCGKIIGTNCLINNKVRLIVDVAMTVLLPMLMAYSLIGERFHEVIGTLMFLLFIFHHVTNRRWYSAFFKGDVSFRRVIQTGLDFVLMFIMLLQPVSGMLMSKHLYTFIDIPGIAAIVREMHLVIACWGFVLLCIHAGMHLVSPLKRMTGKDKRFHAVLFTAWIVVSGYGGYTFIERAMPEYMFHRQIFAFIDVNESKFVFFAEHAAVMMLFMLVGYGINLWITVLPNNREKHEL